MGVHDPRHLKFINKVLCLFLTARGLIPGHLGCKLLPKPRAGLGKSGWWEPSPPWGQAPFAGKRDGGSTPVFPRWAEAV